MRKRRGWLPAPVALAITSLSLIATASCARTAPTGPDSVELTESPASIAPVAPIAVVPASASSPLRGARVTGVESVTSFDLTDGTFSLTTSDGYRLTGRYRGRAVVPASGKDPTASLDLHVETGSGALAGASGTLRGEGKGAFTGEGPFWLSLDGKLSMPAGAASRFHAVVMGTSRVSCVNEHLVAVLPGSGSAARFGHVEQELQHQVGNAGCSP